MTAQPTRPAPRAKAGGAALRGGLSRTSTAITTAITDLVSKRKLDAGVVEELEELLIRNDFGVDVAARVATAVGDGRYDKMISAEEVKAILAAEIEKILTPVARPLVIDGPSRPFVILVCGRERFRARPRPSASSPQGSPATAGRSCWPPAILFGPPPSNS